MQRAHLIKLKSVFSYCFEAAQYPKSKCERSLLEHYFWKPGYDLKATSAYLNFWFLSWLVPDLTTGGEGIWFERNKFISLVRQFGRVAWPGTSYLSLTPFETSTFYTGKCLNLHRFKLWEELHTACKITHEKFFSLGKFYTNISYWVWDVEVISTWQACTQDAAILQHSLGSCLWQCWLWWWWLWWWYISVGVVFCCMGQNKQTDKYIFSKNGRTPYPIG